MEKRRLPFITILYGIAAILVILGHSHPLHGDAPKFLREDVRGFLYVFHMPLFFMISGILSRYTAGNRDVMIIAFALAVWLYRFSGSAFSRTLSCLLMLYFTLSLSCAITRNGALSKSRAASFLAYVGRHAFTIFVYSWPMQAVAEMALTMVLKVRWFVTYPVMFATGLCGPLLLYEFYAKRMRRNDFMDALLGVNQ